MRAAHLFAGAGGSLLAGDLLGWKHVVAAEVDPYCRAVLAARWPGVELRGDVGAEPWRELAGRVDLVVGGWPCQPVSSAGRRLASADHRDGWPALARAVRLLRPRYLFLENVAAVLTAERGAYFGRCLADLAAFGFNARWTVLRASDAGAPHRRERLWLFGWLADSHGGRCEGFGGRGLLHPERPALRDDADRRGCEMADPDPGGRRKVEPDLRPWEPHAGRGSLADPGRGGGQVGGVAHADRQRHHERDPLRHPRGKVERGGLADPQSPGWGWPGRAGEAGDGPPVQPDRCGSAGPSLGPMGGGAHGLAPGLPWPGASGVWPAGRGQDQAPWEPPRTTGRVPLRRQQLKALGNGWVPAQAVLAWRLLTGA